MKLTKKLKKQIGSYFDNISCNDLFDKYLNSLPINKNNECVIDVKLKEKQRGITITKK